MRTNPLDRQKTIQLRSPAVLTAAFTTGALDVRDTAGAWVLADVGTLAGVPAATGTLTLLHAYQNATGGFSAADFSAVASSDLAAGGLQGPLVLNDSTDAATPYEWGYVGQRDGLAIGFTPSGAITVGSLSLIGFIMPNRVPVATLVSTQAVTIS